MSHELRTPLNVILGYSELLLDGAFGSLAPSQNEVLRRLDDNACQLLEMINTTLDLGRLDAGRLPLEVAEISLVGLLADIETETRNLPKGRNVQVHWQVPDDLPRLHTDPLKLKVVLKNLISNALKFTLQGEVSIIAAASDGHCDVEVRDTGTGIAKETIPIIFEAFRQGDSSPTRRFDGAGLGLYIVQRLLEVLGGSISVRSELDKGSTFRLRMPLKPRR